MLDDPDNAATLRLGNMVIDLRTGAVDGGAGGRLSPTERALLARLADARGTPVSLGELLEDVWGYSPTSRSRTVATTFSRLRTRVEHDPGCPTWLLTVHGEGYMLAESPTPEVTLLELVGREAELNSVLRWLADGQGPWLSVIGGGGTGKSTLLSHLAGHPELLPADAFPSGLRLLRPASGEGVEELVGRILAALPTPGLLCLVDLEELDVDPIALALAEHLAASNARVVAAARRALDVRGEGVLPLPPLAVDAVAAALEPLGRAHLAAATFGLPLGLHLARSGEAPEPDEDPLGWLEAQVDAAAAPRHRTMQANRSSTCCHLPEACLRPGWADSPGSVAALAAAGLLEWTDAGEPTLPCWLEQELT